MEHASPANHVLIPVKSPTFKRKRRLKRLVTLFNKLTLQLSQQIFAPLTLPPCPDFGACAAITCGPRFSCEPCPCDCNNAGCVPTAPLPTPDKSHLRSLFDVKYKCNRPFPGSKNPHFQTEAKCKTFLMILSFICIRIKKTFSYQWPRT